MPKYVVTFNNGKRDIVEEYNSTDEVMPRLIGLRACSIEFKLRVPEIEKTNEENYVKSEETR